MAVVNSTESIVCGATMPGNAHKLREIVYS